MPNLFQKLSKRSSTGRVSGKRSDSDGASTISSQSDPLPMSREVRNCPAAIPEDEEARLQKLLSYRVLDTPAAANFDELTELASQICQTPICVVSLVEKDRQWFKSRVGLPATETSRDAAFCSHAILNPSKVMVVPNALEDKRFCQNELVLGFPNIRFYAGAPLVTPDGFALGTICAIDTVPRTFDEKQQRALQIISHQVVAQLEISKHVEDLQDAIRDLRSTQQSLRIAKEYAEMASISSFENLLLSSAGIEAFESFLNQEFCAENLAFWREARTFKDYFNKRSPSERETEAKQIFDTYVQLGSVKQVNLSYEILSSLENDVKAGKYTADMFEEGRREAFSLMKKDSYTRFMNSSQYKDLMQTVRHIGMVRLQAHGDS